MGGLANACDLSPRALYNHFKGKEDAFRETIRWNHEREIRRSWEASQWRLTEGGTAVDAIVAVLDARFGEARRDLELSPHSSELDLEAVRRCRDIVDEAAVEFQAGFAVVLTDLDKRSLLRLLPHQSAVGVAQLLTDGARGVNQTLPALPASTVVDRYRRMCEALLYGVTDRSAMLSRAVPQRRDTQADTVLVERTRPSRPPEVILHVRAEGGR